MWAGSTFVAAGRCLFAVLDELAASAHSTAAGGETLMAEDGPGLSSAAIMWKQKLHFQEAAVVPRASVH